MEQGSPEWHDAKRGKISGSKIQDLLAKGKLVTRKNYAALLMAERLTGQTAEGYVSPEMEWGIKNEPQARLAYEFKKDVSVQQVGFLDHPKVPMSGVSPDGLVGDDGGIEIKCPNTTTHLNTIRGAEIKPAYLTQMQWGMAVTGRKWWDFVSFDPRLPMEMQLHIQRVERDDAQILFLEREVAEFHAEIESEIKHVRALCAVA